MIIDDFDIEGVPVDLDAVQSGHFYIVAIDVERGAGECESEEKKSGQNGIF